MNDFFNYARDSLRIEAAVVEHHVRAVIARIRTTDAGGIRKLATARRARVQLEIH